jgi:hypothetical protein
LLATSQPYQPFHPVPANNNNNPQENGASETNGENTNYETLGDQNTDDSNYDSDISTPKKPTKTYAAAAAGDKTQSRCTKRSR